MWENRVVGRVVESKWENELEKLGKVISQKCGKICLLVRDNVFALVVDLLGN